MVNIIIFGFMAQFIFSISVDGKIKAWLYDDLGSRIDNDAPGLGPTKMAYSADGQRFYTIYMICSFICHACLNITRENLLLLHCSDVGFFHAEPIRMGSHSSLNGMKVKVL